MNTPLSPRKRKGIEKRGEYVTPYTGTEKCIRWLNEKDEQMISKTLEERIKGRR